MTKAKIGDTGTLDQLGVQAGDVVECVKWDGFYWTNNREYKIQENNKIQNNTGSEYRISSVGRMGLWRIVSRATPQPTLWRDMTDAEQGALLLAKHRGEELQMLIGDEWFDHDGIFAVNVAYRVKPKPVVEVLKLEMRVSPNGCLYQSVNSPPQYLFSVDRVDGEIDCSSAVMVKL